MLLANLVLGSNKKIHPTSTHNEKRILKILASYGLPIGIWLGLSTLLNVSDRYFIKWLMTDAAVGTYSAIYDVVYNSFGILLAPVLYAAHPMIMRLWNTGEEAKAMRVLRQSLILEFLIGVVALVFLSCIAGYLVILILGVKDETATGLVVPVAAGAIMWQFAMLLHKPLEIRRKPYRMIAYVLIAFLCNALGNWLFIPNYGYTASAYITVISSVIYMVLVTIDTLVWRIRKKTNLQFFMGTKLFKGMHMRNFNTIDWLILLGLLLVPFSTGLNSQFKIVVLYSWPIFAITAVLIIFSFIWKGNALKKSNTQFLFLGGLLALSTLISGIISAKHLPSLYRTVDYFLGFLVFIYCII